MNYKKKTSLSKRFLYFFPNVFLIWISISIFYFTIIGLFQRVYSSRTGHIIRNEYEPTIVAFGSFLIISLFIGIINLFDSNRELLYSWGIKSTMYCFIRAVWCAFAIISGVTD